MTTRHKTFLAVPLVSLSAFLTPFLTLSLWYRNADHTSRLLSEHHPLVKVQERLLADSSTYREIAFTLTDESGRRTNGHLRMPLAINKPLPALLILGGRGTGARAAGLIDLEKDAVLCAMDYPECQTEITSLFRIPATVNSLHQAAFDAAGMSFNVLDYLCRLPEVDKNRITVLGASFGAPFAVIASLDQRVAATILIYGAGDLQELIDWNLRRKVHPVPLRKIVSFLLGSLCSPFEPSSYMAKISPRPLLMVNSIRDEKMPEHCVRMLYNSAEEPKELIWLNTGHVHPSNRVLIDRLTNLCTDWLVQKGLL